MYRYDMFRPLPEQPRQPPKRRPPSLFTWRDLIRQGLEAEPTPSGGYVVTGSEVGLRKLCDEVQRREGVRLQLVVSHTLNGDPQPGYPRIEVPSSLADRVCMSAL